MHQHPYTRRHGFVYTRRNNGVSMWMFTHVNGGEPSCRWFFTANCLLVIGGWLMLASFCCACAKGCHFCHFARGVTSNNKRIHMFDFVWLLAGSWLATCRPALGSWFGCWLALCCLMLTNGTSAMSGLRKGPRHIPQHQSLRIR